MDDLCDWFLRIPYKPILFSTDEKGVKTVKRMSLQLFVLELFFLSPAKAVKQLPTKHDPINTTNKIQTKLGCWGGGLVKLHSVFVFKHSVKMSKPLDSRKCMLSFTHR